MIDLTCDTCGEVINVTLSLVGDEVAVVVHPSTECKCVDNLTPTELMDMVEDAYSEETLSS